MPKAKSKTAVKSDGKSRAQGRSKPKARSPQPSKVKAPDLKSHAVEIHGFKRGIGLLSHVQESPSRLLLPTGSSVDGECHIFGMAAADYQKKESEILKDSLDHWQKNLVENRSLESIFLQSRRAPLWILRPRKTQNSAMSGRGKTKSHHYGLLDTSPYAQMRDRVGGLWHSLKDTHGVKHLGLFFHDCTDEEIAGALVGLEVASYRFNQVVGSKPLHPHFRITAFGASKQQILSAKRIGESVNLARHLVNLDAAKINPDHRLPIERKAEA